MFDLEVTDTFGGEPNYCWVRCGKTKVKSRRGLIRALKQLAGWDRVRVRVHHWDGDFMEIRPSATSGINQVAFAVWNDE